MAKKAKNSRLDWERIRLRWISGATMASIVSTFGVSRHAVDKHRKEEGWDEQRAAEAQRREKKRIEREQTAANSLRDRLYALANDVVGKAEKMLPNCRSAKALQSLARAVVAVRDIADIRNPLDDEEQIARIERLKKEISGEDQTEIRIVVDDALREHPDG